MDIANAVPAGVIALLAIWAFIVIGIAWRYLTFPRYCADCGRLLETRTYVAGFDTRSGRARMAHFYACPAYPSPTPADREWSERYERCHRYRRSTASSSNTTVVLPAPDRDLIDRT